MDKKIKDICYKYLKGAFERGLKSSPMDANNSEYHLPALDLKVAPDMTKEILGVVEQIPSSNAGLCSGVGPKERAGQQDGVVVMTRDNHYSITHIEHYQCLECGAINIHENHKFCPNCGRSIKWVA